MYIIGPTHSHHPDNAQDRIRFKNLLHQLETSALKYPGPDVAMLLKPLHALFNDKNFWNHTLNSLALFRSRDLFEVYGLQHTVSENAIVATSFHIKPLKKYLQTTGRFQVLSVTREQIKLHEGNRENLNEIAPGDDVPRTIQEALGHELTDEHITVASYNGPKYATPNMYHGHGSKKDEIELDAERFFQVIDRAIYENHSKRSG